MAAFDETATKPITTFIDKNLKNFAGMATLLKEDIWEAAEKKCNENSRHILAFRSNLIFQKDIIQEFFVEFNNNMIQRYLYIYKA